MRLALSIVGGFLLYVLFMLGVLWLVRRASDSLPPSESDAPPPPPTLRDITLGQDAFVGERLARLRKLQQQQTHAHKQRQGVDLLKRGF